ncbi:MAG TPA: DUF4366 domain-containing protein [Candidatus Ornithomonoglobus merdipullorum]|uniref:DUF4366 domain-containing protein n=1 Tax=Candidatus Ornithomonoglobus merdipullorum TaxID=2840895 RepID=A0A9D1MAY2_9FIRM|nr:DUF4366 domain-containing protein [Candidatus Ornithomonoglobus merdipullorum]
MSFKNIISRTIAAVLCMAAFSLPVSANVSSDTETSSYTEEELSVNDGVENKTPLTPSGTLTTVDDVHQVSDEDTIEDKQFITVQSKNGNTFYIIIDRSGDAENVYFLNAVDETDLMALMEDEQKEQLATTVCTCSTKCELGSVNAECAVCSENKDSCTAAAAATQTPEKQEPAEEEQGSSASVIFLILFALAGAGGAIYWFKIRNKKSSTKGDTDPNDLFEEDEDYEIEETEVETEQDDEAENDDNEEDKEK